jgi:glycosyltransferase involved in cell wall biosynthesis
MENSSTLYLVIPCYNEQEVLNETARRLHDKMAGLISLERISGKSRIVFVNDGSADETWQIIRALHEASPLHAGLSLSRNRGHQNALLAGLMYAKEKADVAISMDADLQDDIEAIDEMLARFQAGLDIVYGVRGNRKKDSFFKRVTAEGFYRFMNMMGATTVFNHADYRLMSKRALAGLAEFTEVNLFLRGIVPLVGYSSDTVFYERGERFAGESKYPFHKMLSFAIEGITSLSIRPLRLITGLGFFIFLVSIGMLVYSVVRFFMGETIVGWTTLMVSLWGIGGLILLALGIVGEYIGKIYLETKGRPRFIVEEYLE